ncbi:MAG: AAA family ATPase [Planctomycetota bacterium]
MLYGRRLGDIGRRIISFNLLQMQETRAFQKLGHANIYTYARGRLHLSKRRCREYLATARALEELPSVDAALHAGKLTWSQVVLIARRATPTCEAEWIEAAGTCTYEQLELAVKTTLPGRPPRKPGDRKGLPEIRFPMEFQLDPVTHARWEAARAKLSAERGTPIDNLTMLSILLDLILTMDATGKVPGRRRVPGSQFRVVLRQEPGGGLSVETSEGLVPLDGFPALVAAVLAEAEVSAPDAPDAGEQGAEPGTGLGNAPTPAWLRQLVLERDGFRCRHCSARTDLNAHHIHFRENGGPTVASNLVALCLRCHGLVHAKLLEAVGSHGASVTFRAVHEPAHDAVALATSSAPAYGLPPTDARAEAPVEGGGGVPPLAREGGGVPPRGVLLQDVPARVDAAWWQRHTPALTVVGGARGTGAAWMLGRDIAPLPAATGVERAAETRRGADAAESRRAEAFAGLHGLERTCQQLEAHAKWAESHGKPFPHTLLMGPAGTGKSLLARRVAQRAGGKLVVGFGGMLSSPSALPGLLSQLCAGDVLFLDELHAVPRSVLEGLYLAMTDRELPLTLQQGGATTAITLEVAPFTLVAATTDEACVPPAMASRFVVQERIGYYLPDALAAIARDAASAHGVALEHDAGLAIAAASRGTPRETKRLVTNVLATRMGEGTDASAPLDARATRRALGRLGYEESGLSPDQVRYLGVLQQQRGVIALSRAAALAGIPARTVYDDVEPTLVARNLIEVTPHGRRLVRGA